MKNQILINYLFNSRNSGLCDVIRGNSFVTKLMVSLANEGKSAPTVNLVTVNNQKHEFWSRNFEGKRFRTIESKNHFGY